jgi:hypothetical protein
MTDYQPLHSWVGANDAVSLGRRLLQPQNSATVLKRYCVPWSA